MTRLTPMLAAALALTLMAAPVHAAPVAAAEPAPATTAFRADDPAIAAAVAEAQRTLPGFLELLVAPPAGAADFAVRFPLGGWEHVWLANLRLDDDRIVGDLANEPVQPGFAMGQQISVPLAGITDWAWRDGAGVMHGHRTTRVLLARLDPREARAIRSYMGWRP